MSIVTLEVFKAYIRDEANGVGDDILQGYLDAASRALGNGCHREFVVATTESSRSFQPQGRSRVLFIDDCTTITSVVDNGTTLVHGTDYQKEPLNGKSSAGETVPYHRLVKPYTCWYSATNLASVTVTATWGWAAIPYQITQACLTLAKELCNNQDVRFGIVAVTEAAAFGVRQNKVVREALTDYIRYDRIGIA